METSVLNTYLYPVVSCAGISSSRLTILNGRIRFDRMFGIIEEGDNVILRRDSLPKLCLIRPSIDFERNEITIYFENDELVTLPLNAGGEAFQVRIVKKADPVSVFLLDNAVSQGISERLDGDYRLVRVNSNASQNFAFRTSALVIGEESRAMVSSWSGQELSMDRFRPNIVVQSLEGGAFREDDIARMTIGDVTLSGHYLCDRCAVTIPDPETAIRGVAGELGEPLRSLKLHRSNGNEKHPGIREGYGTRSFLGRYFKLPESGIISPGDGVTVTEWESISTGLRTS